MARAIRSLPTPLSPVNSTVARVGPTRSMAAKISCMASLRPIILSNSERRPSSALSWRFSSRSARTSSALLTTCIRWSRENGLSRKSVAPAFMASTAVSTLPYAVIMTTGTCAFCRRISARNSCPSMRGSFRSVSTMAARSTSFNPSSALAALSTSNPADISCSSSTRRSFSSSSTTRMRFFMRRVSSFGGFGGHRIHGQRDAEDAAFAGFALHCYLTAVLVHDLGDNRQAQPHSRRFGGEKGIENVLYLRRADAHSAVDHRDLRRAPFGSRLHRDRAPVGRGLRRVEHQIVEHPLHQLRIESKGRNLRRVIAVDGDPRRLPLGFRDRPVQQVCQVRRLHAQLQRARELQKPRDQRIGAVHFRRNESRQFARHFVLPAELLVQYFRRGLNRAQRIAQFVRQSRRELSQRRP